MTDADRPLTSSPPFEAGEDALSGWVEMSCVRVLHPEVRARFHQSFVPLSGADPRSTARCSPAKLLNMSSPAPGWYPDPTRTHAQRFRDGQAWTSQTAPLSLPAAITAPLHESIRKPSDNRIARYGLTFSIIGCLLAVFAFPGLILGIIGLKRADQLGGQNRKSALWAVILSAISLTYATTRLLLEYTYGY